MPKKSQAEITQRRLLVAPLLAEGLKCEEIAERMDVSALTIRRDRTALVEEMTKDLQKLEPLDFLGLTTDRYEGLFSKALDIYNDAVRPQDKATAINTARSILEALDRTRERVGVFGERASQVTININTDPQVVDLKARILTFFESEGGDISRRFLEHMGQGEGQEEERKTIDVEAEVVG